MKLKVEFGNTLRELVDKANELSIPQENIVQLIDNHDGTFMLLYYNAD